LAAQGYNVQMYFNGSATAGLTINLTGTVANGDVYVVAQSSAAAAILAQADQTNGSGWFTADNTLRRKASVEAGDANGSDGFDPSVEWDGFAQDTFDGLGSHATTTPDDDSP